MLNAYTPHAWVIVKIQKLSEIEKPALYKVLCGEYGGYAYGDSWRLNSGVDQFEETVESFLFHGRSGSCYDCKKSAERLTGLTSVMLAQFQEKAKEEGFSFEMIDSAQFKNEFVANVKN